MDHFNKVERMDNVTRLLEKMVYELKLFNTQLKVIGEGFAEWHNDDLKHHKEENNLLIETLGELRVLISTIKDSTGEFNKVKGD